MCEALEEALKRVREMTACPALPAVSTGLKPHFGAVEVSDRVSSINYFLHMPFTKVQGKKNALVHEFVWDPLNLRFATILYGLQESGSPHQMLARALAADEQYVCGGSILYTQEYASLQTRTTLHTNEFSGHFWEHWTPQIREQYVKYMGLRTGLKIDHHEGV